MGAREMTTATRLCALAGFTLLVFGWSAPGKAAEDGDFQLLFNGKDLGGWDGDPRFWRVEEGAITGQTTKENPTKGNTFIIWRGGTLEDFELRIKFRIDGGNSGVQYRSKVVDGWVIGGYQADIDATGRFTGILYEERGRGILAQRGKKVVIDESGKREEVGTTVDEKEILDAVKQDGWNEYVIVAKGNRLVQILNGKRTVDVTDNEASRRSMSGLLALQLHAGPPMKVQFKDIRLKRLSGEAAAADASRRKVVFVAGTRSHGYGAHEHNAGCLLLARLLMENMPGFDAPVHRNGWPEDPESAFAGADALVLFCDGGGGHMALAHLDELDRLMDQGVGLACLHYAVDVPKGKPGELFRKWIGGCYEAHWSVNPHWEAEFVRLPEHPITRGVAPFALNDEWYFHMRFRQAMEGVTPVLSAVPPETTMRRPDGANSGNPQVRAEVQQRRPQHVAWAAERPGGGRGFGFTGGHFHQNWADDSFRTLVLNAIVWVAHGPVPPDGVSTPTPTQEELEVNQDFPKPQGRQTR
jgi:type 1 glutamine amidotransferase